MNPINTPSITQQDTTPASPFGGIGRSIGDLIDKVSGVTRYQAPTAPVTPTYTVRGTTLNDNDLHQLAATMFGEISNRNPQKQNLEADTIANTALNRVGQYKAQGGQYANYGLGQVLSQPNQYQAYNGPEYKRFLAGSTTPVDQQKIDAINSTIAKLKSGNFPDTTGGRVYYMHDPSGKIWLKDGSLFKAASGTRAVSDITQ